MQNQVTNGFDRMTISQLLVKASFIISEMTANAAYFSKPDPTLAEIQAALTEMENATLAAENRDRVAIAYRNEKREELIHLLRKLGVYVNLEADGNRAIAISSGFDLAKERHPAPPINYVDAPVVKAGVNAGQLDARVKKVNGARAYQYLITPNHDLPLAQWSLHASTKSNCQFTGLESAKRYYVRVAALGINNQLVYSDMASFVTQ